MLTKTAKLICLSLICLSAFLSTGCNNKKSAATESEVTESSSNNEGDESDKSSSKPSKAKLIKDLKSALKKIKEENFSAAAKYFQFPKDVTDEEVEKELSNLVKKKKLSSEMFEDLEEEGEFGLLEEIFPTKAANWMEESEIKDSKLDKCYAYKWEKAQIAAYWNGKNFQIFRYHWPYEYEVAEQE